MILVDLNLLRKPFARLSYGPCCVRQYFYQLRVLFIMKLEILLFSSLQRIILNLSKEDILISGTYFMVYEALPKVCCCLDRLALAKLS
jgi:hypothetical protein